MTAIEQSASAARRTLAGIRSGSDESPEEVYAAAVWSVVTEPGDSTAGRLVARFGPAAALSRVLSGSLSELIEVCGPDAEAALARWRPRLDGGLVDDAAALARRAGARLVVPADDEWPRALDDLGHHAPLALWARGRSPHRLGGAGVAIVGARAASAYGEHVASELASELAADGIAIVSGAAYGIDGAAHSAALATGGATVALLAGGVDRPYPAGHAALIERIARTGAVLGETPCGTPPTKWRFLARNRLIAALSDATVVVEAGVRSGSLNTAAHAASLGRPLGAVPGPVTSAASAGCHRVLREFDGVCITGPDDVRELLGMGAGAEERTEGRRTDDGTRVRDALSVRVARPVAEIARRSGLSVPETEALLGLAALAGEADAAPGGWRLVAARG